jgi:hypothetical protein
MDIWNYLKDFWENVNEAVAQLIGLDTYDEEEGIPRD